MMFSQELTQQSLTKKACLPLDLLIVMASLCIVRVARFKTDVALLRLVITMWHKTGASFSSSGLFKDVRTQLTVVHSFFSGSTDEIILCQA